LLQPQSEQPYDFPVVPAVPAHVVAIGTSAGGLHALSIILEALPAKFPAPIVVVQHLSPDFPSRMAQILGSRTALTVKEAQEKDHIGAGCVYIAPPGKHLLVGIDETLSLTLAQKVHHSRPSVDVLFESVAASAGARAIGVILTGGDGSVGIQAIKAAGGVTIAQDQASSHNPSMPRNAAETGDVDFVLPLSEIAAALADLVRPPARPYAQMHPGEAAEEPTASQPSATRALL